METALERGRTDTAWAPGRQQLAKSWQHHQPVYDRRPERESGHGRANQRQALHPTRIGERERGRDAAAQRVSHETDALDVERVEQLADDLHEIAERIRAPRLGRLSEAGKVEADDPGVWHQRARRVAPRLGKPAQAVDQEGRWPLTDALVVEGEPIERAVSEADQGHDTRNDF